LPGNLHITVPGCEGDVLLYLLDERGIHVSTGSACQAGVPEPSHVLMAMGVDESEARGALRFSLGYSTTEADIDQVISVFADVVRVARSAGLAAG
jgi:cysteine desulfurase